MSDVAALIVAAGQGSRFGGALPKVFVDLAGAPLFTWALRAFEACPDIGRLLVAVAPDHLETAGAMCQALDVAKPWRLVAGGLRRQDTVVAGLEALADDPPEIIAIQDGARPLIDPETISHSVRLARQMGACVTAAPVTDTIKRVAQDQTIVETPDRAHLWRAQTPQTFRYDLLTACYRQAEVEGWEVTDDASVVEGCGYPVRINPGPETNIKITTPEDLTHAEAILRAREDLQPPAGTAAFRVGHGYDVHALVSGRKLILGGVHIRHETGLAGHSDADVLLHAICDALLGATALGDIGHLFPDTDPSFEGADSMELTREVARCVHEAGFGINNVDATVIAQRPKLAPHIPTMRQNVADALGVELSRVSVKATTTERLGFAGREEGIAAHAVATVTAQV